MTKSKGGQKKALVPVTQDASGLVSNVRSLSPPHSFMSATVLNPLQTNKVLVLDGFSESG